MLLGGPGLSGIAILQYTRMWTFGWNKSVCSAALWDLPSLKLELGSILIRHDCMITQSHWKPVFRSGQHDAASSPARSVRCERRLDELCSIAMTSDLVGSNGDKMAIAVDETRQRRSMMMRCASKWSNML